MAGRRVARAGRAGVGRSETRAAIYFMADRQVVRKLYMRGSYFGGGAVLEEV
jgi:hypothetical protein